MKLRLVPLDVALERRRRTAGAETDDDQGDDKDGPVQPETAADVLAALGKEIAG